MHSRFEIISLAEISKLASDISTVVLATLNYEERSVGFLQHFLASHISTADAAPVFFQLLWPLGTASRVDLLEQLKASHMAELSARLRSYDWNRCVFSYPDDFNERQIRDIVLQSIGLFAEEPMNLVVDISCMPRRVLVSVCTAIEEALKDSPVRQLSVYFVYSSPKKYAALRYAQNVGGVQGYFSGRPIYNCRSDHISAYVFPSLQGYEGKLLFDEVCQRISSNVTAFVAVNGRDFPTSLATMRANQFLLEQREIDVVYYFSWIDGMEKLARRIETEVARSDLKSRMVLAAPFGPKIFTLAAFFMLSDLKDENPEVDVEIAHVSGFQYLSLYSLGLGDIVAFRLLDRSVSFDDYQDLRR